MKYSTARQDSNIARDLITSEPAASHETKVMSRKRVAIVAGGRTPFVRAGRAFAEIDSLGMAIHAVRGMLDRSGIDPALIESVVFGTMTPDPLKPNLARELVFEAGLPLPCTLISNSAADAIAGGRIEVALAGGVDSLTRASLDLFREPSTGLTMGEHMELTVKEWDIPRQRQDEVALASHRNAVAARGKLAEEIHPLLGEEIDSGPRADTSIEALATLKPVFDPDHGTLTAGNSSPVTDGAAAVLLMSEEKAAAENIEPLAFIGGMAYAAHDPAEGLLMAPAISVPRLLAERNLAMDDMDLVEIHEAFAAQALASAAAWERGWKGAPTGEVDWDRVNVNGSSIAVGHPWAATGTRILTTLANEMSRRDARYGLVSICAAGAMAGAFLLER